MSSAFVIPRSSKRPYAIFVVAIVFLCLLAAAGLRASPSVLMVPWEKSFGWSRATISFAAATGICLFGLTGPFAAAAMQRFGVRVTVMSALALMSGATAASLWMTSAWQLILLWGVLSGVGSGCIANVLSATIANRWFMTNRGLVTGLLAASTSTGTLIFFPALSAILEHGTWKTVVVVVSCGLAGLIPLVLFFLPEQPGDLGQTPFGAGADHPAAVPSKANPLRTAFGALAEGARSRDFWLLAGTFFVCGLTTNGLVGTHMIALCSDHGLAEVTAGSLLAMMGLFDLVGTTASGWLTDRFDPRKLLFAYYGLRGLSLIYLPHADFTFYGLSFFAVFYGLDWIATVPPTLALANRAFGEQRAPVIFGWISASHQLGAATAAALAGASRTASGSYLEAFVVAGAVAVGAAVASLFIATGRRPAAAAA
ncbi:MAG: MFS transporter [Alphaproteobacteria bacterium]|nr:MFS transporter [Alphaproteobacteria bacterium]MBL6939851.1 MFS transporter [Alphaproteobacteria bacterium]MBL7098304.1 MFS transporter [Alphaproteobacteria bacterium]